MNTDITNSLTESNAASKEWFKDAAPILFLVDVVLMFSAMFFDRATFWVFVSFQCVVAAFGIFTLYLAYRAAQVIPKSIPLQRPTGVVLYVTAHLLQYTFPGQLPLVLTGYVLLAAPVAIVLLFVE